MQNNRKQKLWLCAAEPFPRLARPGPSKSERGPALSSSMGTDAASFPASTTRMSTSTREAHRSRAFSFASEEYLRVSDRIAAFAKRAPKANGFSAATGTVETRKPAELPSHQLIDTVTSNNPVFVNRLDGHMALANAAAMKLAGMHRKVLRGRSGWCDCSRSRKATPPASLKTPRRASSSALSRRPPEQQIVNAIRAAQQYAVSNGVTSVAGYVGWPDILRAYQALLRRGELRVRVSGHQPLSQWKRLAEPGMRADSEMAVCHIGGLKGFADGSLGSTTAWFFQPYIDAPATSGIASDELLHPDTMYANIRDADAAGLQIAIHAIGDRANNTILNFYQRLEHEQGRRDRRLRIEHAQHLLPADIPRFGQLNVIASMQPYHCIDDGRWAEKRIGPERAKTAYAFRSLLDAGAVLAFGSDWDVAPMKPLLGIYAAVTRRPLDGKPPERWVPNRKLPLPSRFAPTRWEAPMPLSKKRAKARSRRVNWRTSLFSPETFSASIRQKSGCPSRCDGNGWESSVRNGNENSDTPLPGPARFACEPLAHPQQLARDIYRQSIEINTADSAANVTGAAKAMAEHLEPPLSGRGHPRGWR